MNEKAFLIKHLRLNAKDSYSFCLVSELIKKIHKLDKRFSFRNLKPGQSLMQYISSYKPENANQAFLLLSIESLIETLEDLSKDLGNA